MKKTELSDVGYSLRERLAEIGIEVTPDELRDSLLEAHHRIGYGECQKCGNQDDLRYGFCFDCCSGPGSEEGA